MRKILSLAVLFLSAATAVYSQTNYATLSGTVFDPQQQAVPGSTVQLTSESTRAARHANTNDSGSFQIAGLAPGKYELVVQAQGFATITQSITLEVGQSMTLDLNLKLASVSSVVDVQSDAMNLLKTADASVGEVVEPTSIRNLPLNGRMLIDLILTVPAAHESHGAQAGDMSPLYWRPGQRSAVSIGGNRPNANYFLLDGATNTDHSRSVSGKCDSGSHDRSGREVIPTEIRAATESGNGNDGLRNDDDGRSDRGRRRYGLQ